jgi:hypothetical protein
MPAVAPPPASVDNAPPPSRFDNTPARTDNPPPSRFDNTPPSVKPQTTAMEKSSSFPQARPTPDQSQFTPDDRSANGSRPIAGSSQPGNVVPAGHSSPMAPPATEAKWKASESANEKPLPQTTPVSAGNSAFRQPSASGLAKAPERKRYDVTIYKVMDGDTWEKVSKLHYLDERCAAALRAYNQAHARSSDRLQREGTLLSGETIVVPPLKELMDNHEPLISHKDSKPQNVPSTSFAPPNTLPQTVSGNNNAPPSVPAATSGSSGSAPPGSVPPPPPPSSAPGMVPPPPT